MSVLFSRSQITKLRACRIAAALHLLAGLMGTASFPVMAGAGQQSSKGVEAAVALSLAAGSFLDGTRVAETAPDLVCTIGF